MIIIYYSIIKINIVQFDKKILLNIHTNQL